MTPRKKVGYFTKLDPSLLDALRRYRTAVGVPVAEAIDRALRAWLAERPEAWPKGVMKTERKRAVTRKRPYPSTVRITADRAAAILADPAVPTPMGVRRRR